MRPRLRSTARWPIHLHFSSGSGFTCGHAAASTEAVAVAFVATEATAEVADPAFESAVLASKSAAPVSASVALVSASVALHLWHWLPQQRFWSPYRRLRSSNQRLQPSRQWLRRLTRSHRLRLSRGGGSMYGHTLWLNASRIQCPMVHLPAVYRPVVLTPCG